MFILPTVSSIVGTASMCCLLALFLYRYIKGILKDDVLTCSDAPNTGNAGIFSSHPVLSIIIIYIISRCLIILTVLFAAKAAGDPFHADPGNILTTWSKWDAPHYLGLIRDWYVNEGDAKYHIVFFPLYPLICRILLPIFGNNVSTCAYAVSNLSAVAAGILMYMIYKDEYNSVTALWSVAFFFFNPLSFFLSIPYTESLFMLLTLGSIQAARKGRFCISCCLGTLCAATRLMGIIIAAAVFYEMLRYDRKNHTLTFSKSVIRFSQCLSMLTGVLAYLLLNYHVTGSPFTFWAYQRDHWYNTSGTLWNTFSYIVSYSLNTSDVYTRIGIWISAVAAIYGALGIMFISIKKANPRDGAYSWLYMYMTIIPTWLISGARYVSALYCLYPMTAASSGKWYTKAAILILSTAALSYMSCLFVFHSAVY